MVGEQKNKKMASVVFHVFSCLLGFIMIYPLLWLVASSFKSNDTMFKNTYSVAGKLGHHQKLHFRLCRHGGVQFRAFLYELCHRYGHRRCLRDFLLPAGGLCGIPRQVLRCQFLVWLHHHDHDDPRTGHGRSAVHYPEKAPPQRYAAGHDPAVGIRRCVLRLFDRAVHARHPQRAG